jgi:hypothetical protein
LWHCKKKNPKLFSSVVKKKDASSNPNPKSLGKDVKFVGHQMNEAAAKEKKPKAKP